MSFTLKLSNHSRARQQAVQKQRLSQKVIIANAVTSDAFVPLADARGSDYWAFVGC